MKDDNGHEIDTEILNDFLESSFTVLQDLKESVRGFNGVEDVMVFENFGQQIDRIMGSAYTLSLISIGDLTKLAKELSYKASQVKQIGKLLAVQSLLSQVLRLMEKMLLKYQQDINEKPEDVAVLVERMKIASAQLGDLRISVKVESND